MCTLIESDTKRIAAHKSACAAEGRQVNARVPLLRACLCVASLSGCAFIQTHVAQIAVFGTVAGAVASTEGAVVNGLAIRRELKDD